MPLTAEQLKLLKSLKPRAYRQGTSLAFTSPTWGMRKHLTLEQFIPDLEHPTRGVIAWRDFANIPSNALKPFFSDPNVLDNNAKKGDPQEKRVTYDHDTKTFTVAKDFRPKVGRVYSLAADLSVSGDATGIAMTHVEPDGKVEIDFSLRIVAKPRVDYRPIEDFFTFLRDDLGFVILGVSFDQFQSHRTIEELRDRGFDAKVVRYADSFAGCSTISDLVHSGMLIYHIARDDDFIGEAKELQSINDKRVDHVESGGVYNSKDVWDAVVNATIRALEDSQNGGVKVNKEDLKFFDPKELYERSIRDKDLPIIQFAFIYTRLGEEVDPNTITCVHAARDVNYKTIYILDYYRRHVSMQKMAEFIVEQEKEWGKLPYHSTYKPRACEITAQASKSTDALSDALQVVDSNVVINPVKDRIAVEARIEATKQEIKTQNVVLPKDWEERQELSRLVKTVLSHPYIPDNYDLQALGGLVANIQEVEYVVAKTTKSTTPVLDIKGW